MKKWSSQSAASMERDCSRASHLACPGAGRAQSRIRTRDGRTERSGCSDQRYGGGARAPRRGDRPGHARARRQRGGRGGRHGFALAVTAARRQHRRRRLHGGPRGARQRGRGIDYRETAPAAATRDMFLGADGKPDPTKTLELGARRRRAGNRRGPWARAPGTAPHKVADWSHPLSRPHGKASRSTTTPSTSLPARNAVFARSPASARSYCKATARPSATGTRWSSRTSPQRSG